MIWEAASFRGAAFFCCYLLKPENIFYLCIIMKNVLFCILMIYVVCGCRAELSDELASRIPFLFKQVVRDSGTYFFTFEQIDNRVFYRNDQPYMACVYLDMLLGTRIPVEPGAKRYDYFAGIFSRLVKISLAGYGLMRREKLVLSRLLPILPGSSMYGWSGRRIRFLTGRIVMYSNGIMMSRLFPRKVIMSHGKPM